MVLGFCARYEHKAIFWYDCHAKVTLSLPKQRFFIFFTLWPFKIAGVQWQPVWNIHHPHCSCSSVPEYMGAEMGKKLTVPLWKVCFLPWVPDETSLSMCLLQINQHSYFPAQNLHEIAKTCSKISGNNEEKYRKFLSSWNKGKMNNQHYRNHIHSSFNEDRSIYNIYRIKFSYM